MVCYTFARVEVALSFLCKTHHARLGEKYHAGCTPVGMISFLSMRNSSAKKCKAVSYSGRGSARFKKTCACCAEIVQQSASHTLTHSGPWNMTKFKNNCRQQRHLDTLP